MIASLIRYGVVLGLSASLVACGSRDPEGPATSAAPVIKLSPLADGPEKTLKALGKEWPAVLEGSLLIEEGLLDGTVLDRIQKEAGLKLVVTTLKLSDPLPEVLNQDLILVRAHRFDRTTINQQLKALPSNKEFPLLDVVEPNQRGNVQPMDPANEYLIPYLRGITVLGVREAALQKAFGKEPIPAGWGLVMDPRVRAKINCGVSTGTGLLEAAGAALIFKGVNPVFDTVDVATLANSALTGFAGVAAEAAAKDLASGKSCVAVISSAGGLRAEVLSTLKGAEKPSIRMPVEGGLKWSGAFGFPAQGNFDRGRAIVERLFDVDVARFVSQASGFGVSTMALVAEAPPVSIMYADRGSQARLFLLQPGTAEGRAALKPL